MLFIFVYNYKRFEIIIQLILIITISFSSPLIFKSQIALFYKKVARSSELLSSLIHGYLNRITQFVIYVS